MCTHSVPMAMLLQVLISGYTYGWAQMADLALAAVENMSVMAIAPWFAVPILNALHMATITLAMRRWVGAARHRHRAHALLQTVGRYDAMWMPCMASVAH